MILRAPGLLASADRWIAGGALRLRRGTIVEVLEAGTAGDEPVLDLGEGFLAPGLVNAHAHLELGELRGALPAKSFVGWIHGVVASRARLDAGSYRDAFDRGAARALATGTTTVGDIDSTGACAERAAESGLRVVCYREVLDAGDPRRTPGTMRRVQRKLPRRRLVTEGLSPHAPYTTSVELLRACARLLARRPLPVAVHWAESADEDAWLRSGAGPFAELLERSPGAAGLDLLQETGLLGPGTALIHGNHPSREEVARVARAGASVVHCPGTHRFFGRAPFPVEAWRRAGVPLALGTDSLASNEDLDLAREMRLALEHLPGTTPAEVFGWATEGGARALGLDGRVGRLAEGFEADVVWHRSAARSLSEALEAVVHGGDVGRVWVAGTERGAEGGG